MLSNAYFLAKFRFDAAENEPAKNLQDFVKFANFASPKAHEPLPRDRPGRRGRRERARGPRHRLSATPALPRCRPGARMATL